jgi:hypothetical protein
MHETETDAIDDADDFLEKITKRSMH